MAQGEFLKVTLKKNGGGGYIAAYDIKLIGSGEMLLPRSALIHGRLTMLWFLTRKSDKTGPQHMN